MPAQLDFFSIFSSIVGTLGLGAVFVQWLKNRGDADGKKTDELGEFRKELRAEIKEIKLEAAQQEEKLAAKVADLNKEMGFVLRDLDAIKYAFAVYRVRSREVLRSARAGEPNWQDHALELENDYHEVDELLRDPSRRRTIRGCRILLADDAPDACELYKMGLELKGAIVEVACDGRQALGAYNRSRAYNKPFDILLLDYSMPHESGLDVLKIVRDGGDAVPAALFTASGEVVTGDLNADVWVKPMGVPQLIARIEALLH